VVISDRVTVLRNGKKVATLKVSRTEKQELTRMMMGEKAPSPLKRKLIEKGKVVLQVKNLSARNDRNVPALRDVSFVVYQGEIVGIAGVAGNGQRELIEVITGLRKAIRGRVAMGGEEITNLSPREVSDRGVAHIPESRLSMGVVPQLSVVRNLILKTYRRAPFCKGLFLNPRFISQYARELTQGYRIITPGQDAPVSRLSGGNIQKLILARELSQEPDLIIASHPTYGLDLKTTQQIRSTLLREREKGTAILLVSEDLEEIMSLSDRIGVMFEGEIRGLKEARELTMEEIGAMMTGSKGS
jgi:simple sugar transport system ATP-binding protein